MPRITITYITLASLLGMCCLSGCQSVRSGDRLSAFSRLTKAKPLQLAKTKTSASEKQTADLQFAMGRTLEADGNIEQAIAAYRSAVKGDPSRADALVRQAILYDQQGRFGESAQLYQQALEANPGNPDIFADVGYSFYLQDRLEEAETNLRQAIALDASHQRAHNNLGLVLARRNRPEEALAQFRRAGCSQPDAHANVAFAMMLEQRFDEAKHQYRQALLADPESSAARTGLDDLETIVSKFDAASEQSTARAVPNAGIASTTSIDRVQRVRRLPSDVLGNSQTDGNEWFRHELNGKLNDSAADRVADVAPPPKRRPLPWVISTASSDP